MAIDAYLIERVDRILDSKRIQREPKRMMGGLCYMVDDKMCFATIQGGLMVRVDPEIMPVLLERNGAAQMAMKGRPMRSFLLIDPEGYDTEADLEFWIKQCLDFNPRAKSSKKRK